MGGPGAGWLGGGRRGGRGCDGGLRIKVIGMDPEQGAPEWLKN